MSPQLQLKNRRPSGYRSQFLVPLGLIPWDAAEGTQSFQEACFADNAFFDATAILRLYFPGCSYRIGSPHSRENKRLHSLSVLQSVHGIQYLITANSSSNLRARGDNIMTTSLQTRMKPVWEGGGERTVKPASKSMNNFSGPTRRFWRRLRVDNNRLLTFVEANCETKEVKVVFVYLHGFPDIAVRPDDEEKKEFVATNPSKCTTSDLGPTIAQYNGSDEEDADKAKSPVPEVTGRSPSSSSQVLPLRLHEASAATWDNERKQHYASQLPRKLSERLLKDLPFCAHVSFNTNGMPGSCGTFFNKTLTQDFIDVCAVVDFVGTAFPPGAKLVVAGISTGGFLCSLYASHAAHQVVEKAAVEGTACLRPFNASNYYKPDFFPSKSSEGNSTSHPFFALGIHPRVVAVVALASVDDVPDSPCIDFSLEELHEFETTGQTQVRFDIGNGARLYAIGVSYLRSFAVFPKLIPQVKGFAPPPPNEIEDKNNNGKNHDDACRGDKSGGNGKTNNCAAKAPTNFLLVHGENDRGVPVTMGKNLFSKLREHVYRFDSQGVSDDLHAVSFLSDDMLKVNISLSSKSQKCDADAVSSSVSTTPSAPTASPTRAATTSLVASPALVDGGTEDETKVERGRERQVDDEEQISPPPAFAPNGARLELLIVEGANHLFTKPKHMKIALSGIVKFVQRLV